MTDKPNCWDVMLCGHDLGGTCPALTAVCMDGVNGGHLGGRICWALAETACGRYVVDNEADKKPSCASCRFFQQVIQEEGDAFVLRPPGMDGTGP